MSAALLRSTTLHFLFLCFLLLLPNTQSLFLNTTNPYVPLNPSATTRLDLSGKPTKVGKVSNLKAIGNMAIRFRSDGSLTWSIDTGNVSGKYQVSVVASYFGTKTSVDVSVNVNKKAPEITGKLTKVSGHFSDEYTPKQFFKMSENKIKNEFLYNYHRHTLDGTVTLSKGVQTITLTASNMINAQLIDFRSLELTPISALDGIQNDESDAIAARASTNTLVNGVYGIMLHWTDLSVNLDGSEKSSYAKAVDQFNVPKFVKLCQEVGAKHVLFTLNHQHPHCPAPIPEWEAMHPTWTTSDRDLIGEIADGLDAVGIDLMLYIASHLVGKPDDIGINEKGETIWLEAHQIFSNDPKNLKDRPYFDIIESNKIVMAAIGERYGSKVKGFWLDGFDLIPESYPEGDWQGLFESAKVGYEKRLVSYNRWVFPTVTPWQDYWAGEIDSVEEIYEDEGEIGFAAGKGLRYHGLIAMEDDWVLTKENLDCGQDYYKPRFNKNDLIQFVQDVQKRQGVTTINLAIEQNGNIMPKTLTIMKKLKAAIRTGDDDDGDNDDENDDNTEPTPAPTIICKDGKKKFKKGGKKRTCKWLSKRKNQTTINNLCKKKAKHCKKTCGFCDDGDDDGDGTDDDSNQNYQTYNGKGYCLDDDNEESVDGVNSAVKCWEKCKSEYGYLYAEFTEGECYCQKKCSCMDSVRDMSITTIAPVGFSLPKEC